MGNLSREQEIDRSTQHCCIVSQKNLQQQLFSSPLAVSVCWRCVTLPTVACLSVCRRLDGCEKGSTRVAPAEAVCFTGHSRACWCRLFAFLCFWSDGFSPIHRQLLDCRLPHLSENRFDTASSSSSSRALAPASDVQLPRYRYARRLHTRVLLPPGADCHAMSSLWLTNR